MYIGNDLQVAESGNKIIDDISSSFNGSTTSFALLVGGAAPVPFPINTQQIYISVNGVIQEPDPTGSAGFKLLGNNIVFSSAPTNGHAFFGVILSGADYVTVGTEFPAGSATAPSITFGNDNNTGLYSVTGGTMGFTSDGVQTFTLDGNGFNLPDNKKLFLGSSSDFQIWHDATNNVLRGINGQTWIQSDALYLSSTTGQEQYLAAVLNGAVTLMYDSSTKFATTTTGTNTTGVHVDDGATHDGDVTFTGASANVLWDKSTDDLIFSDNAKAIFGTSSDGVEIYHDGSNSYIHDGGTGGLYIRGSILGWRDAGNSNASWINANAGAGVELYHAGSKKIETSSTGVTVTGGAALTGHLAMGDNYKIQLGSATDGNLRLYHNASNSYIDNAATGHIYIRNNEGSDFGSNIYIQPKSGEDSIVCTHDGEVSLYYDNSQKFLTTTNGIKVENGCITTTGANSVNETSCIKLSYEGSSKGQIRVYGADASTTGSLEFKVCEGDGTDDHTMLLDGSGRLILGAVTTGGGGSYYDDITINNSNTASGAAGGAGIDLISGNATWGGYIFSDSDATGLGYVKYDHSNNRLILGAGSSDRVTIDSNGNVGIGTTSPFNATNYNGLELSGTTGGVITFSDDEVQKWEVYGDASEIGFYDRANTRYVFQVKADQDIEITDGNLVIGTGGHGIDFGTQTATSATGSTTTSELLDHYEEGTWTGSLYSVGGSAPSGGSLTTNSGVYTRIGRYVQATIYIGWDNQWTGAGGVPGAIKGLPFIAGSSPSAYGGVALAFANLPSPGIGSNNSLAMYLQSGQDYVLFYQLPGSSGGSGGTLNASNLFNSTAGYINFTVSYWV